MFKTIYTKKNINLTTTQINIHQHIIIINISKNHNKQLILINPKLLKKNNKTNIKKNYLSIPKQHTLVPHTKKIKIHTLNHNNKPFKLKTNNLLTIYIQHKINHLINKLFINYLSPLKQQHIHQKIKKLNHLKTQT